MPFPIEEKFVVAVASSALFDLTESDRVFREQGEEAYRKYQRENEQQVLNTGVAFPLVRRLLGINSSFEDQPVEVVLLSRNDPDTGLRVFKSIEHYGLPITRAAFVKGSNPFIYMDAFNASLFLSANPEDVKNAVELNLPAGRVFPTEFIDNDEEQELRIAFDFDGILVDDSAETLFREEKLERFQEVEKSKALEPLPAGPLQKFFSEVAKLQKRELKKKEIDANYISRIRVAIATARNAPAHERMITTLRTWGIQVDEAFLLGGIDKERVLKVFRPHIFFDDQLRHIEGTAKVAPSVHVPFGVANLAKLE